MECEGGEDAQNISARQGAMISGCELPFFVRKPCGIILGLRALQCTSSVSNDERQRQVNDTRRSCHRVRMDDDSVQYVPEERNGKPCYVVSNPF